MGHHDDYVAGHPDRRVETRNPVGHENVAGELGIDELRAVASSKKIVGLVEEDLMGQAGSASEAHEQRQQCGEVLELLTV